MAPLPDRSVEGKIYFLTRLLKYVNEKPYTLRYRPDNEDGLPQTNIERTIQPIDFHDLRAPPDLPYESCGFKVVNLDSAMQYEDYEESTKVETIHVREVEACIKAALAAESAEVLDHVVCLCLHSNLDHQILSRYYLKLIVTGVLQIRRRDQNWPVSTGQSYQFQQPASAAHIGRLFIFILLLINSRKAVLKSCRPHVRSWLPADQGCLRGESGYRSQRTVAVHQVRFLFLTLND